MCCAPKKSHFRRGFDNITIPLSLILNSCGVKKKTEFLGFNLTSHILLNDHLCRMGYKEIQNKFTAFKEQFKWKVQGINTKSWIFYMNLIDWFFFLSDYFLFLFLFFNIYLFLRQRGTEHEWGRGRERKTQNLKQAPGSELSAQSPTWGSNSRTKR